MSKINYTIELPKTMNQLESLLQQIFKSNPNKHYIIRLLAAHIDLDELNIMLDKYRQKIENFKRNKSIVLLSEDFDYEAIPDFIPLAPTEEEALDIIDFEEIERDLLLED